MTLKPTPNAQELLKHIDDARKASLQLRDALLEFHTELARIQREIGETDEKTPRRPPSRADMRAAVENAQAFPHKK